ncbi:DUF3052 domain-containing protein [Streptomyces sp. NP160]|uniref:DUF3052 domain-containing protein n=1 Tax=Streptomyces sp. NP160 TaxID=2586637 RepID=UPI001119C31D|nr:DUF3052 domain-containing protein [Streptomyces sp. NP160]TNM67167.1 DUF3052 domain-containing protein [Streptomyces sp. NP160]
MSETAGAPATSGAARLGLRAGQAVQERGYDHDVDHDLRDEVEDLTGEQMLDEHDVDVVDAVLLWWREDDGDLVDALVDSLVSLADDGVVWLLTPKAGSPGHVRPSDVEEAAPTAGLFATSTVKPSPDWTAIRLVSGRGRR